MQLKTYEKGEPEYELARVLWMIQYGGTPKSFERLNKPRRDSKCREAAVAIELLYKNARLVVMHESNVDGG